MPYLATYTDTFGGEPNFCWVRRATVSSKGYDGDGSKREILQRARAALGLTGVRGDIIADYGDEWHWRPRGSCTVLMVRWDDVDV